MKQPHKHAELIKAWADGAEIEYYWPHDESWLPAPSPSWDGKLQYRIKPEPTPDTVLYSKAELATCDRNYAFVSNALLDKTARDNIRLTFDGETGKLKKAEVIE